MLSSLSEVVSTMQEVTNFQAFQCCSRLSCRYHATDKDGSAFRLCHSRLHTVCLFYGGYFGTGCVTGMVAREPP